MSPLNVVRALLTVILISLTSGVSAEDNLFIFVFKNGVPQPQITVRVGDQQIDTNDFGLANFDLPAEHYEVGYYQGNELFAVTEVSLLNNLQSQIFLDLTSDSGAEVDLDLPLGSYQQDFEQAEVKEQTGPKGTLRLKVIDSEGNAPVTKVKLFFKGYSIDAATDENGVAEVELSEGSYDVSLIHPKYVMQVMRDIEIRADATNDQSATLTQADIVLDEYVVSAPFVEGSLASTFTDLKDSNVLGDAISSEQFSKSGDSSASGALKRVTGITIVDGKFVFVRGLGERYSTVLLNGLHIPSPEPTKRVVPLDIFPTGVIQSMNIQKTYSSDLPGTFGGGTVLINSKDIPKEDNFIQGSFSVSMNDYTKENVMVNTENDRPLPQIILDLSEDFGVLTQEVKLGDRVLAEGLTAEEKEQLNSAMVNYRNYGLHKKKLQPGKSISITTGQSFKTSNGLKYGFAGSIYHKTEAGSSEITQEEYEFNQDSGEILHTESNSFNVTKLSEKYGGLFSFGLDNLDGQKVKYTFLRLNQNDDVNNVGVEDELIEDRISQRTFLQYTEKTLTSHQFNGEHHFSGFLPESWDSKHDGYFDDVVISWGAETADATRLEPGTFEYEYKEANDQFLLDAKKLFYLYSDLEDEVDNYRVDLKLPFRLNGRDNYTQIGWFDYEKARTLDNRRFKIKYSNTRDPSPIDEALTQDNVDNGTIDILDSYKPDDFYTAEQTVTAYYINQLISPINALDINFGARMEESTQSLQVGAEQEASELETDDVLPFLGATYRFDDEHQLRLGASQTLSRPDFREFSPNRFKDPLTGNIIFGYDKLEPTEITNFDIKYEWFPSFDEFISFGLFAKKFTNPIETVRTVADVDIEISYRNAKSAESFGFETGFRKNLSPYWEQLENFFMGGNFAYIKSEIELDKDSPENENDQFIPFLTSENRPMQGQSPYVVNFQFGYDNFFTRRSATLLYNVYGKRISSLGINGNPDIYEQPFHRLDFVLKWGLNDTYDEQEKRIGYTLTFKVKNLLDSEIEEMQGEETTTSIKPGREYSLTFSMKY
ncbi:MAG: TonB-dependent receptor plug domain-containing protein [Pseudomonadales bacterium]|nr:TonB-dependent receptor plug domain-containing protein [Pseudomonadales bacterium]